ALSPAFAVDDFSIKAPDGRQMLLFTGDSFRNSDVFVGNGGANLAHATGLEGYYNTCIGMRCMTNVTTGMYNTGGGYEALDACTTCAFNTGFGEAALSYNRAGNGNTALGWKAGMGVSGMSLGDYNTVLGYSAMIAPQGP